RPVVSRGRFGRLVFGQFGGRNTGRRTVYKLLVGRMGSRRTLTQYFFQIRLKKYFLLQQRLGQLLKAFPFLDQQRLGTFVHIGNQLPYFVIDELGCFFGIGFSEAVFVLLVVE